MARRDKRREKVYSLQQPSSFKLPRRMENRGTVSERGVRQILQEFYNAGNPLILLQLSSYNEHPLAVVSCSHLLGRYVFQALK